MNVEYFEALMKKINNLSDGEEVPYVSFADTLEYALHCHEEINHYLNYIKNKKLFWSSIVGSIVALILGEPIVTVSMILAYWMVRTINIFTHRKCYNVLKSANKVNLSMMKYCIFMIDNKMTTSNWLNSIQIGLTVEAIKEALDIVKKELGE